MIFPTNVTRTSIRPKRLRVLSTKPATCLSSRRSTLSIRIPPLEPFNSAASLSSASLLRAHPAILAPALAKASVTGYPRPPVAPASSTVFPVKSNGLSSAIFLPLIAKDRPAAALRRPTGNPHHCLFQPAQAKSAIDRSLQDHEEKEDREGGECSDRHLFGGGVAVFLAELHQTERIGAKTIDRHHRQRPEELIPAIAEREDREHRERRQTLGHDDLEQNAQLSGAVDSRRLDIVGRNRDDGLPHQENAKRIDQQGRDDTLIGVDPFKLVNDQKRRNQRHLKRQHQRAQDQQQHDAGTTKMEFRQAITGESAEYHIAGHYRQ